MLITDKVEYTPHICGIQLDMSAQEFASGNLDTQPFYNTNITEGAFKEVYYSIGSARFTETSSESRSGTIYTQRVAIKFPSNDKYRSQRIDSLRNAKFLSIKLSSSQKMILGRNDFFQNTKPKVSVRSTEKITQVEFESVSIFPSGFFENTAAYGYVYQLPISLLEAL